MRRQFLLLALLAIVLTGLGAYLFSLFPKPTAPDAVYFFAPLVAIMLGLVVVEAVLLHWRPSSELFTKRQAYFNRGKVVAIILAALGAFISGTTLWVPHPPRTASRLALVECAFTFGFVAVVCVMHLVRFPKQSGQGLFVVAGL